jgi:hypothetical protein
VESDNPIIGHCKPLQARLSSNEAEGQEGQGLERVDTVRGEKTQKSRNDQEGNGPNLEPRFQEFAGEAVETRNRPVDEATDRFARNPLDLWKREREARPIGNEGQKATRGKTLKGRSP